MLGLTEKVCHWNSLNIYEFELEMKLSVILCYFVKLSLHEDNLPLMRMGSLKRKL